MTGINWSVFFVVDLVWLLVCLIGSCVVGAFKAANPMEWLHWVLVGTGVVFLAGTAIAVSLVFAVSAALGG